MALALALGVASACVGQPLRDETARLQELVRQARHNGAKHCAPKDLARAEVYLDRAIDELDQGSYRGAKTYTDRAQRSAQLAFDNSPPEKCSNADGDGDGIPNRLDRCPDRAEDKDGFQDEDGCPDPDNDGDGIPDARDECPNAPEDLDGIDDEDGCPDDDADGDGIPDARDKCPSKPEDHDGFEDEDGCPDPDNDGDKILDVDDKCPDEPEDFDGDQDDDGCPDKYKLVVVTAKKIELRQKVYFATAKTKIRPRSYPLLQEVALVLRDKPSMRVRIEGHTDSRGSDAYNLKLSDGRANSVRAFLIKQGVEAERLEAVGFGEARPIADDRTRSGRALNRRVEFFITKR